MSAGLAGLILALAMGGGLAPAWGQPPSPGPRAATPAPAASIAGSVEPGSVENEVTVTVRNRDAEAPIQQVDLELAAQPEWLTNVRIDPDAGGPLAAGAARSFRVRFDVLKAARPGERGSLSLRVVTDRGLMLDNPNPQLSLTVGGGPPPPGVAEGPAPRPPDAGVGGHRLHLVDIQWIEPSAQERSRIQHQDGAPGMTVRWASTAWEDALGSFGFTAFPDVIRLGQPFAITVESIRRATKKHECRSPSRFTAILSGAQGYVGFNSRYVQPGRPRHEVRIAGPAIRQEFVCSPADGTARRIISHPYAQRARVSLEFVPAGQKTTRSIDTYAYRVRATGENVNDDVIQGLDGKSLQIEWTKPDAVSDKPAKSTGLTAVLGVDGYYDKGEVRLQYGVVPSDGGARVGAPRYRHPAGLIDSGVVDGSAMRGGEPGGPGAGRDIAPLPPNQQRPSGPAGAAGPDPPGPPAACDLAGSWRNRTNVSTTWTFRPTAPGSTSYAADETGGCQARGTATLTGHTVRLEWACKKEFAGVYEWELDAPCTSGRGSVTHTGQVSKGRRLDSTITRMGELSTAGEGRPPGAALGRGTGQAGEIQDPDVARHIREWLAIAEPPINAKGGRARYDEWGRVVGQAAGGVITATAKPDDTSARAPIQYVWDKRDQLDSLDHCTLGTYVTRRVAGQSIADCARTGSSRSSGAFAAGDLVGRRLREAVGFVTAAGLGARPRAGPVAPTADLEGTIASATLQGKDVVLDVYTAAVPTGRVPNVVGRRLVEAKAALESRELTIDPVLEEAAPSAGEAGRVYRQDPAPEIEIPRGTSVRVWVYGQHEAQMRPGTPGVGLAPGSNADRHLGPEALRFPAAVLGAELNSLQPRNFPAQADRSGFVARPARGWLVNPAGGYVQMATYGSTVSPIALSVTWHPDSGQPCTHPAFEAVTRMVKDPNVGDRPNSGYVMSLHPQRRAASASLGAMGLTLEDLRRRIPESRATVILRSLLEQVAPYAYACQ